MAETDKILKADKEKKLIKGFKETLEAMKLGKTGEVFVTRTCSDVMRRQLKDAAEITKVKITELPQTAEELSAQLKKPFTITVLAILAK
jgi:ribosomal protein L30E